MESFDLAIHLGPGIAQLKNSNGGYRMEGGSDVTNDDDIDGPSAKQIRKGYKV